MDKLIFILLVFMSYGIFSCKSDTADTKDGKEVIVDEKGNKLTRVNPKEVENPDDITVLRNMHIAIDEGMIKALNQEATAELEEWWVEHDKKSYIALDEDLYVYNRIHDGNSISDLERYSSYWVDYGEDLTYLYGKGSEVIGSGRYYFDSDDMQLLMVDDDNTIKPRKYDVKTVGANLIIVGDPQYKDSNFQGKLVKATSRPD